MAAYLAWSEVNVCEGNLLILALGHPVQESDASHTVKRVKRDQYKNNSNILMNVLCGNYNCNWDSEEGTSTGCRGIISTHLRQTQAKHTATIIIPARNKHCIHSFCNLIVFSVP